MEEITLRIRELFTVFGVRVIAAVVILILGWWVAKIVRNSMRKVMTKRDVDPMLVSFVGHLAYALLMIFVILAALGKLGVQTTSFVAVVGAAGLAIGLALQGALANFAAGVLMLIFRPFKVGDYIEGGGTAGVVEEIQIFTTKLKTPDNKLIIVPNAKMTGDNITNYSAKEIRRVDLVFGVGYGDDIDKVKTVIEDVLSKEDRILKDPPITIGLVELGDSSVNFAVRPWVKTEDYWGVYFDVNEAMKKRFDAEGISIPFPQRDVHMYQD
jgi:small conductance mechanosensitive channel